MDRTGYQGSTNYPTWAIKLWIDNDEGLYYAVRELAQDTRKAYDLARRLKELVEEFQPELDAGMFSDLLGYAIEQVNWLEIAESLREEVDEEEAQV
jgi:hypothetical protein